MLIRHGMRNQVNSPRASVKTISWRFPRKLLLLSNKSAVCSWACYDVYLVVYIRFAKHDCCEDLAILFSVRLLTSFG